MLSQYLVVICLIVAYTYAFYVILLCLGERWDGLRFQRSQLCISCILGGIKIVLHVKPLSNNEILKKKKKKEKNGTLNLSPFSQFAPFIIIFFFVTLRDDFLREPCCLVQSPYSFALHFTGHQSYLSYLSYFYWPSCRPSYSFLLFMSHAIR